MNKTIIWVLAVLVIVIGIFYVMRPEGPVETPVVEESTAYFYDRMITLAIEDVGMAIEGFDDQLLMVAYPGLTASDFAGVESLEGHYEIEEGHSVFVRDQKMPMSSAERTISQEGYGTLLQNVSMRLNMEASTEAEIDALIDVINTSERAEVRIGETASVLGLDISPTEVVEDSRCPSDVVCIQAGRVRVRAAIASTVGHGALVFETGVSAKVGDDFEVTLERIEPEAHSETEIAENDYVFYFIVSKR